MIAMCPVCGKKFDVLWPQLYRYRRDGKYLCSYQCLVQYDRKEGKDMIDTRPVYTDEVLRLIHMRDEMVYAKDLAPIVKMKPDVIIKYAKDGKWPREICNFIVSGNHVKFFRIDFLRKGGWIQ